MKIYQKPLWVVFLVGGLALLALAACNTGTPLPPTTTPEPTATATKTATATPLPSPTPSPTPDPASFIKEAEAKFWQSDVDGAIALYQKALETQSDYAPAYIGLSLIETWIRALDFEEGVGYAQKAVEADPENAMAHATLAYAYVTEHKVVEAMESAEKAVALDPENAYVQAILARAYLADRRYDEAQAAAEKAYTLDPESVYANYSLANVYKEMADFSRARAVYEHVVTLKPEFFGAYQGVGWFCSQLERYDAAEAAFNKALELAPENLDVMLGLTRMYAGRHEYETAETWLEKAAALEVEPAAVVAERSNLYYLQEKYDEALEQINQALKLMPDKYSLRLTAGFTYLANGECSRAESEFQSLIEVQPRFANGQIGLGFAKLCDGDANKALTYLRKATELEPYNDFAYRGMGMAYALQERWEDSNEAYVEAIRLSPAPAAIHASLGEWYLAQGMLDEAEAEYQLAADMDPYLQDPLVGLARIWMNQQQEARALTTIQNAVALNESDWEAQRILGTLTVMQGDPESGAAILESVLDEDPENAYAHYALGIAYCQMGKYRDAKKELETFKTLSSIEDNWTLDNFITSLDRGFTLSEDKAIEEMQEFFDQTLQIEPKIVIEEASDATRVMTVTIPLSAEDINAEDSSQLYRKIGLVSAIVGARVPQIDPPVTGGVLMLYERSGKPQFTMRVTLDNLKRFFYGWLGGQQFASTLEFTQILTSGAQTSLRDVERRIAKIRELDFMAAVPSEVMTKDELRTHLSEDVDQEEQAAIESDETMLELFGLIDPSQDLKEVLVDVQTEQTAGFYTPEDDKFYVLEAEKQSAADQTVIAHEYVHALQDQHFDLAPLSDTESDDDRRLAFRALLEGDATLSTVQYADKHIPVIDMLNLVSSASGTESEAMESSPMVIQATLTFPYDAGLEFVSAIHDRDGWEGINEAYANPPQSTEQILHPDRYWDGDDPKPVSIGDLAGELGGAWKELDNDVMGELGLRLTLATHVGPVVAAQATEGWGGDRYVLLQAGDEYVLVLSSTWDDEKEATEFLKLYRTMMEHRADFTQDVPSLVGEVSDYWWLAEGNCVYATQEGEQVTVLVGTTREAVEQVLAVMQ